MPYRLVGKPIPDDVNTPINDTFEITPIMISSVSMKNLEHITVSISIDHERRGDVKVVLNSPNNIRSVMLSGRSYDTNTDGFANWTMMTVAHWYILND